MTIRVSKYATVPCILLLLYVPRRAVLRVACVGPIFLER